MAGNSQRRGAGHKGKSSAVGSGGRGRKALKGRGPTPKAEDRVYHKAYKAKQERLGEERELREMLGGMGGTSY